MKSKISQNYFFLKNLPRFGALLVIIFASIILPYGSLHAQQSAGYHVLGQGCTASSQCITGATCDQGGSNTGGICVATGDAAGMQCLTGTPLACGNSVNKNESCEEDDTIGYGYGECIISNQTSNSYNVGGSFPYTSPLCGQNQVAVLNSSTNLCYCMSSFVTTQTQDDPSCKSVVSASAALNPTQSQSAGNLSAYCPSGQVLNYNASSGQCSCTDFTLAGRTTDAPECLTTQSTGAKTQTPSSNPLQGANNPQGSPTTPPSSNTNNTGQVGLYNPLSAGTNLNTLVDDILQLVVKIGSIVIILMLVETGFEYVVARGDSGKLQKLHKRLLFIVIGALILLGAEAIALGIQATVQALSAGN